MDLYYSRQYSAAGDAFDTTRKAGWIAESLDTEPIEGIRLVAPAALLPAQLRRLHEPAYVEAVRSGNPRALACSQGFDWDPGLWRASVAMCGGMVCAARRARIDAVAGCLGSGFHHAKPGHGEGFCTFNGLALAAAQALDDGAGRVLIIDLDAHCGGGTQAMLGADPRVVCLDIALVPFDVYTPSAPSSLDIVSEPGDYLPLLERRLRVLGKRAGPFDLCLYYAGMDVDSRSQCNSGQGFESRAIAARETRVFDWALSQHLPIAFGIAGGYTGKQLQRAELVALHRLTLAAGARCWRCRDRAGEGV